MNTTVFNSLLLHQQHQGTPAQLLEQVCYQVREHGLVLLANPTQGSCSSQGKDMGMWMQGGGEGDGTQSCNFSQVAF